MQEPGSWQREGSQKLYDLRHLEPNDETIYYKNRWIHENGLEQHLIVTYSPVYRRYQEALRERQVLRAEGLLRAPSRIQRKGAHDPRRFVTTIATTHDGEIASAQKAFLDEGAIRSQSMWDGYYAVCTNLEGGPLKVIAVNKKRREIEAAFRIMKTKFRARPVFLSRDDRIQAHFMTRLMAFMLYKTLEKKFVPCCRMWILRARPLLRRCAGYPLRNTRRRLCTPLHAYAHDGCLTRIFWVSHGHGDCAGKDDETDYCKNEEVKKDYALNTVI